MRGPLWFVRLSAECSRIRTTCDMMFNAGLERMTSVVGGRRLDEPRTTCDMMFNTGLERMTSVVGGRRLDEPFPSNIKQFLNWVVGSGALSKGQRRKLPHP